MGQPYRAHDILAAIITFVQNNGCFRKFGWMCFYMNARYFSVQAIVIEVANRVIICVLCPFEAIHYDSFIQANVTFDIND
ncbi:hypothetical protein PMA3_21980 [Pseudomonas silesiensis]|uniref:Uncharacterized protein n=1 Tax=Pseudomonas silesiensis TaxID=1853130 RepID=A0A191YXS0_9PSED|nr:hypothetical protein PMA3_21980 [Pseudomonas silesiensis]